MRLNHLYRATFTPAAREYFDENARQGIMEFEPAESYVVTLDFLKRFIEESRILKIDFFEKIESIILDRKRIYEKGDEAGRVLILGYYPQGDMCFHSAFAREFLKKHPQADLSILTLPNTRGLFKNTPVKECEVPYPYERFAGYDEYMLIVEGLDNLAATDTRTHVHKYCDKYGIEWSPECDKPELIVTEREEKAALAEFYYRTNENAPNGYAIIQMHSTNTAKDIPVQTLREIVHGIRKAFPDLPLLVCGAKQKGMQYYASLGMPDPQVYKVYPIIQYGEIGGVNTNYDNRELLALIKNAKFVVSPDSFFTHAAAAFDVPSVTIYGAYAPESHCANYKYCVPIYHKEKCVKSPCRWSLDGLPPDCPSREKGDNQCAVMAAATSAEVIAGIRKLLEGAFAAESLREIIAKGESVEYPVASE